MGNNVDVLEVFKARKSLENQREFLNVQHSLGIIDADGVRNELELISKKEQAIRDRLVLNSHVTADGLPRSIAHHEPTPNNPKDYYSTKMPDGKKIKAVTYDGLMEKLFAYYTTGIRDYSIESVFNAALHEKRIRRQTLSQRIELILNTIFQKSLPQRISETSMT